jgi:hypothetical protein
MKSTEPTPEVRYAHHQTMYLGFAISALGEAIIGRENNDIVRLLPHVC